MMQASSSPNRSVTSSILRSASNSPTKSRKSVRFASIDEPSDFEDQLLTLYDKLKTGCTQQGSPRSRLRPASAAAIRQGLQPPANREEAKRPKAQQNIRQPPRRGVNLTKWTGVPRENTCTTDQSPLIFRSMEVRPQSALKPAPVRRQPPPQSPPNREEFAPKTLKFAFRDKQFYEKLSHYYAQPATSSTHVKGSKPSAKASGSVMSSSRRSLAGGNQLSVCSSGKSTEGLRLYSPKSPRCQSRQQLRSMLLQNNSRRSMLEWRPSQA